MLHRHWSLRTKLIVACALAQLAATALILLGCLQLMQFIAAERATAQTRQIVALLDQAVAVPWAQRDYASLQQTLDRVRDDASISYLVLWDHRGRVVAASGWDANRALPPRDPKTIDLDRADATWHLAAPIEVGGQTLGRIDLGLPTADLRAARAQFLSRSLVIAGLALVATISVLALIALAITRHLTQLAHASAQVADGNFDVAVPVASTDEVGRLGRSFNAMAQALKQRVTALEEGEARQRSLLGAAQEEQARLTTLLGAMHAGIVFVDTLGCVSYANARFAQLWGLPEELSGQSMHAIVPRMARQLVPEQASMIEATLAAGSSGRDEECELRTIDGRIVTQRGQPVLDGTETLGHVWFHVDVTAERITQQRAQQALHDPLTMLLNRRGLQEVLQANIARAARDQSQLALMFIDLDDFKNVNDLGGHRAGDDLLVTVARALSAQLRRGEIVARLGGDEFAVLCPNVGDGEAEGIAVRLMQATSTLRVPVPGQSISIGCSIGIAVYPGDAMSGEDLIACADTAMYQAKNGGKNAWARYRHDPEHSRAEAARVNWSARIHRALQNGRFVMHFQPVCHAQDMRVAHHEALIRMLGEDDDARLVLPGEFVPYAERSGAIRQIDRWVFAYCVETLAAHGSHRCIAANLSARSLEDTSFPSFLADLLHHHDVDPRRMLIELTETSAIGETEAARRFIHALRALGCSVHLDDFGSGFSSFAQLRRLDVDAVKIDGAFIRDLRSETSNRLFVASMIDIAHSLGKRVVAEHVEDAETLEALRSLRVDLVQGYLLGRPAAELTDPPRPGALRVISDFQRKGSADA